MASSTPILDKVRIAKHRRLVLEFAAVGFQHITQAGINAGYSKRSARSTASLILKRPEIVAAVEEQKALHLAAVEQALEMDAHDIIKEMSVIGRGRITDYMSFDEDGISLKDSSEIPEHLIGAISGLSITHNQFGANVALKLYDKNRGLENLAKVKGMLSDIDTSVQVQLIITGRD